MMPVYLRSFDDFVDSSEGNSIGVNSMPVHQAMAIYRVMVDTFTKLHAAMRDKYVEPEEPAGEIKK